MQIAARTPAVVGPGEAVNVSGENFDSSLKIALANGTPLNVSVASATSASFQVPKSASYGTMSLTATEGNATQKLAVFFDAGKTDNPIMAVDPSKVCSDEKFYDASGALQTGTRNCGGASSPVSCAQDGSVGCVTTDAFKAADMSKITAGSIVAGNTIAGVGGSLAVCSLDGQQNCVVSGLYKAANTTGIAANIRAGTSIAGIAGALKANCRNAVSSAYFNHDTLATLGTVGDTTGTTNDSWDTIDGYYGFSLGQVSGWSTDNYCDSTNWADVTTATGNPGSETCTSDAANCMYKDKTSGLMVTKDQPLATWNTAVQDCSSSTYGGYAAGSWRLPTQKELMQLYIDGIVSLVSTSYMTLTTMQNYFWTASTGSNLTSYGWIVYLDRGYTDITFKTDSHYSVCVR